MAATSEKKVTRFRETLPQILASTANNFFRMNVSLSLGFATIVIAQLHNVKGPLSLDDTSASWFGSIAYICQPVGSVASGVIVELIGRKKFLIAINIPFLLGSILLCLAPSYAVLMLANVIIGLTVGLTEAPNNSYNGEVCQPEIRGAMSASSGIFYQLGFFMQYLLGTLCDWRTAAAISTVIPISTFICVCLIPEVPIWLISRGRLKDAESALRWLRGWVAPEAVQEELSELVRYHEETKLRKNKEVDAMQQCAASSDAKSHGDNASVRFDTKCVQQFENNITSSSCPNSNPNPSSVDTISFSVSQTKNISPENQMQSQMSCLQTAGKKGEENVPSNYNLNLTIANRGIISNDVDQPIKNDITNPKESVRSFQMIGVLRDLMRPPTLRPLILVVPFFFFVHFAGLTSIRPYMVLVFREFQMPITAEWFTVVSGGCGLIGSILLMVFVHLLGKRLISLVGTALSAAAALLLGVYAYVHPVDEEGHMNYTWIPLMLIVTLSFCNSIVEQIPSILISEVYPFRTRGLSVGISVAFCYFFIFLASKTYLDVERYFQLYGAFWFYGCISCVGYVFFHYLLLETEGKSLEEIERHFTLGLSATSPAGRKKGKRNQSIRILNSTHL